MASTYNYFASAMKDEGLLHEHGFDHWPTDEELTRYLMDTNDRISALESALGLETAQDFRGRWTVMKADKAVPA